jgi:bifunctional non-homologous end joining protein LigD
MAEGETLNVEGKAAPVSNLDKIYYPKAGFTTGEMLADYIKIAPVLLPHLKDHPLAMKRYPKGEKRLFYEKQ